MKILLFLIALVLSLPSFALSIDCSYNFEDGGSEQGGGNYFLKINNGVYQVWHNPYQDDGEDHPSFPSSLLATLKKVSSTTKTLKLYSAKDTDMTYEYVKVGQTNKGVLDVRRNDGWFRTYKCE